MDGKSNDNNRNNAANSDDKQNDELSMFRRSNDFRTRKRKKFKDKVEDDISNSNHYDDTSEEEQHHSKDILNDRNTHLSDKEDFVSDNDDLESYRESEQINHYHNDENVNNDDSQQDKEQTNNIEDNTTSKTKHKDKNAKKNWLSFLTSNKSTSKKKEHAQEEQTDSNKKVTQFSSPTLEEKRAQRRRRQKRIQYTVITVLVLLIVIFLLYMFTPLSKISNVNIEGNHNVSKSQINKALNVKSTSRMYTFSKGKAKTNLKKNKLIKDVSITKQLPNTLNVKITEYQVVGLTKNKDKYVPVLEDGKELKDYDGNISHDGPIIDGFKGDKKEKIIQALSEMSPKVRNLIAEVNYAPDKNKQNRIKIFTKDDIQVIGDITTIADKMKYYPQMSESLSRSDSGDLKTDGYIDLSVGASFIPYQNSSGDQSESEQSVSKTSAKETEAKEELQSVLNKINKESKENN